MLQWISNASRFPELPAPLQTARVPPHVRWSLPAGAVHPVRDGSGVGGTAAGWWRAMVSDNEEDQEFKWCCNWSVRRCDGVFWNSKQQKHAKFWRTRRVQRRTDSQRQLQASTSVAVSSEILIIINSINAVHLFVSPFVCPSVCHRNTYKRTRFSQNLSSLELWSLLTTYRKSYMGFSKNPLLDP